MNRFNVLLARNQQHPSQMVVTEPFVVHMNRTDSLIVTLYSDDLNQVGTGRLPSLKLTPSQIVQSNPLKTIKQKIDNDPNLKKVSDEISIYLNQMSEEKLKNILI